MTPLYAALARSAPDSLALLSALRWLVALVLVIVPTTAMGATLPLLTRALEELRGRTTRAERRLGALYAANTLGGALGALAAAYPILPLLGVRGTLLASAAGERGGRARARLQLGRAFRVQPRRRRLRVDQPSHAAAREPATARARELLTLLAFLSGCLVFAAEVVFTHLLALIIGNSAYAFGLILAIFLLLSLLRRRARGLAARAPRRRRAAARPGLQRGLRWRRRSRSGTSCPSLFTSTGEVVTTFGAREAMRALRRLRHRSACRPRSWGFTFPLLLQRVAAVRERRALGGSADGDQHPRRGRAARSLTGYVVLPALGSERSLLAHRRLRSLLAGLLAAALGARRATQRRGRSRGGALALVPRAAHPALGPHAPDERHERLLRGLAAPDEHGVRARGRARRRHHRDARRLGRATRSTRTASSRATRAGR